MVPPNSFLEAKLTCQPARRCISISPPSWLVLSLQGAQHPSLDFR